MSSFTHTTVAAVVSALVLSCAGAGIGAAAAVRSAEMDFRLSCSGCHGKDGRGLGANASGLSVEPPDLTTLRTRNGNVFPRERLRRIIDGREEIKMHGSREMPVWGQLFKRDAEEGLGGAEGDVATVKKRIDNLIHYIEALQR